MIRTRRSGIRSGTSSSRWSPSVSIGVAIGLVAQRAGCSIDDAWQQLVRVSQDRNVKVREIARILIDARNGRAESADAATLAEVASRLACGRPSREQ